jgi:transcriptional regulator with XRE-family HTH domain
VDTDRKSRVAKLLESKAVSQAELARQLGFHPQILRDFMAGKSKARALVHKMSEYFDVPVEWIMTGEDAIPKTQKPAQFSIKLPDIADQSNISKHLDRVESKIDQILASLIKSPEENQGHDSAFPLFPPVNSSKHRVHGTKTTLR